MTDIFPLSQLHGLIIDIDGTLFRGETPLPGLVPFFAHLQRRAIDFVIVTNNTIRTPAQYQQKLAGCGIEVEEAQVLTAAVATVIHLRQVFRPGGAIYVIGEPCLRETVRAGGFELVDDASHPAEVVVVGGDSGLTYAKLKDAILHLQRGVPLIGTNPDMLIPTEAGLVPEAGTTLAALQAATGVAPTVIGKPERLLYEIALQRLGCAPERTAMLGDRLDTDIIGAQRAGLKTILVTTGVDNEAAMDQKEIYPDAIVAGLRELVERWR